jgi:hypothetical protein
MKIYIGTRQITDESYKKISDPDALSYMADDSECMAIVLDNVLSKLDMNAIVNTLRLAAQKLRIGGKLIINDIDFDLLHFVYSKSPNPTDLNKLVDSIGGLRSIITYEIIMSILQSNPQLLLNSVKLNNIEFNLEYSKNG